MTQIKKTALNNAILEANEIVSAAKEGAKKVLEESMNSKLDKIVEDTIKNIEKETLKEDVTINAGDANIEVKTDETGTSVAIKTGTEESTEVDVADIEKPAEELGTAVDSEEKAEEEMEKAEEEIEKAEEKGEEGIEDIENVEGEEEKTEEPEEEIFEIVEDEAVATAEMPETQETAGEGESVTDKLNGILSKLDVVIDKISGEEGQGTEGEVEIIDDTTSEAPVEVPAEAPAEAPVATAEAPVPAEKPEEEEKVISEDDLLEISFDVKENEPVVAENNLEEIEIVDEDLEEVDLAKEGEEEIDETRAMSHLSKRSGNRNLKLPKMQDEKGHHTPVTALREDKTTAQNESKLDELTKENESLKKAINEYKESFVILRKQINEVQTFNAKLAYANKLFAKGGLSTDEKIQIAEQFDKVETIEEAKKLYNQLIKEEKFSDNKITENVDKKLKSAKPATASNSKVLYESEEQKRMKRLAGIH